MHVDALDWTGLDCIRVGVVVLVLVVICNVLPIPRFTLTDVL